MKRLLTTLFMIITMMVSCTPQTTKVATSSDTSSSSSDDDSTSEDSSSDSSSGSFEATTWISSGVESTFLTLSADDTISFYITGTDIATLAADNDEFPQLCMVLNFIDDGRSVRQQLRLRASVFTNLNNGDVFYRIDTSSKADNLATCSGNATLVSASRQALDNYDETQAIYGLDEVCPTCTTSITSASIDFYSTTNGTIGSILTSADFFSGLSLNISPSGSTSDDSSSLACSDVACQASDFDCCFDTQCVDDGQLRSNPDATNLVAALMDVASNPQNFKRWPTVYYVCNTNTGSPIDPDDGDDDEEDPDPVDQANTQLEEDIKDYRCLNEDVSYCDPDQQTVREEVWTKCGCMLDPITSDPLDPRCPDYNLKTVEDTSGTIVKVECDIPVDDSNPAPFQNLNIGISAKTAPHRYFDSNGVNYDKLSSTTEALEQEGEQFNYLNVTARLEPIETSYSINAIHGMFALDKAQPAYAIDVELDKLYIIRSISGFYSPCTNCQPDAWYNAFSSHPELFDTHGLQWRNYTTGRDEYNNNDTKGNYEDTLFGRACWVPPTMLPFSHHENVDLNTQRRNRLSTQAALWVNGYQRDWYGFNKGALIGSFDGVKWFAIGNDRRVKSTSKKLFLAINAPFADIAEPTTFNVSVLEDLGGQSASDFDYNIDLDPLHASQNIGATCQYMHQCEVDSDCVTKLGWEYSCANVNDMKSNWPRFDLNANESENNGFSNGINFENILFNGVTGNNKKRCVYRGAGSLCKLDYTTNVSKENLKKLLACAPNYHCRSLNDNAFNKEAIRTPNDPNNFLLGRKSSVLGRPVTYYGATNTLTSEIKENLAENIKKLNPSATALTNSTIYSNYGLCVPGRDTGRANAEDSHDDNTPDAVDSISQIGACDPTQTGDARYYSCPAFDNDNNIILEGSTANVLLARRTQNMCSGESVSNTVSIFSEIETALSANSITEETLAANACFRRAGSPCFTDLDCSPNRLHAEIAQTRGLSDFGGTLAESLFWQEALVCSQATNTPRINVSTTEEYYNFDMGQNRCCMPARQDFTMYTSLQVGGDGTNTAVEQLSGYDLDNANLNTNAYPYNDPSATGRYSRYVVSETAANITVDPSSTAASPEDQWKTLNETGEANCCGGGFIRKFDDGTNNWRNNKRLNISVQNFACLNYTNDLYKEAPMDREAQWALEYSKFCFFPRSIEDSSGTERAGCIQTHFDEYAVETAIVKPTIDPESSTPLLTNTNLTRSFIEFRPDDASTGNGNVTLPNLIGTGILYYPDTYNRNAMDTNVASSSTFTEMNGSWRNDYYRFIDYANFTNESVVIGATTYPLRSSTKIALVLPVYAKAGIDTNADGILDQVHPNLSFTVHFGDGEGIADITADGVTETTPTISTILDMDNNINTENACEAAVNANALNTITDNSGEHDFDGASGTSFDLEWCVVRNNNRLILLASITSDGSDADANGSDWDYAWPRITFETRDTNPEYKPGNANYYLDRLGKYELLGVPQITQEPIYCNDIADTNDNGQYDDDEIDTVPGLLKRSTKDEIITNIGTTAAIVDTSAVAGNSAQATELHYTTDNTQVQKVFSANEFRCCSKLGDEVSDEAKCCSSYANNNIDGKNRCAIPAGTNLMVYLNRYISNEADTRDESLRMYTGDDPATTATEVQEFDEDGFPQRNDNVYAKIRAIGQRYCENLRVREGSAFGYYVPQPNVGVIGEGSNASGFYSIIDSALDAEANGGVNNFASFSDGFRWNHHLYCDFDN